MTAKKPKRSQRLPLLLLTTSLLSMSACTTTNSITKVNRPFQALGNEPGWSITFAPDTPHADVLLDYGQRQFRLDLPKPQYTYAGTHYRGQYQQQPVSIDIIYKPCSDTMSDEHYDYEVNFTIEGHTLRGCGRDLQ